MTVLASTTFAGGTAGTAVTSTTEPFFTSSTGTVTYAAIGDGRMGMRPSPTGVGQMWRSTVDGRSKFGLQWKVKFESSSATTAYYLGLCLRNGTTVRSDVGLRNASGNRHAAFRNNFTYVGEAAGNTMTAGEIWSFETVVDGTSQTVRAWESDVDFDGALPAATYTWSATLAVAPDNFFYGVDSNVGVSVIMFDIRFTDGESTPAPTPGTLTFLSNVWASQTEAVIVGKVADADEVTVAVGAKSATVAPDSAGYFRAAVTGIAAGTTHAWDVRVDDTSRRTGTIDTLPATADALTILWGSCFDTNTSGVFALMAARAPRLVINLGDWGYQYITGGTNGNTSPTDVATVRAHRETVLAATAPQTFFTGRPVSYTYSDCDGAGANADGTTGGHATGAVQAAYRQQFAHPTLPLVSSGARAWTVGRVRFIHTDETAAASVRDSTDNATKSKLGAEQKTWLKAQIDAAAAASQAVVWFGDGPWIEPAGAGSATYNSWARYNTERTELGAYIVASGVKLIRLHGDTHTLFADDGANNPWGGFPTASAAPFHTTGQAFGYTVSNGKYPTETLNGARQYGVATFTDNGINLGVTIKGYSSTSAAPTEVERFSLTADLTPGVDRVASGVLSLTGTATATTAVTRTVTAAASIDGTASRAAVVARTANGAVAITGVADAGTGDTDRTAQGALELAGIAPRTVTIGRTATGSLTATGTGAAAASITRVATGTLGVGGIGATTYQVMLAAIGTLTLTGAGDTGTRKPFPPVLTLTVEALQHTLTVTTPTLTLEATW